MTVKKWFVGFVLTMVMIATLLLGSLLFAARDFQFALAKVEPQTVGLLDFDAVKEAQTQIDAIEAEIGPRRGELEGIDERLVELSATRDQKLADINAKRTQIAGALAEIETNADVATAESAAADLDAAALDARAGALASKAGMAPEAQSKLAETRGAIAVLAQLEQELDNGDAVISDAGVRQRQLGGQVGDAIDRVNAFKRSIVADPENYDRVIREVRALDALSPIGLGAGLAQGHPALLSIMLVLTMGVLGAILYLFPAYMSRAEPVLFAEIAVRALFGMVAAFAFYVISNAALAGFAVAQNEGGISTSAALNPFTVSLIGILAGVMADDIARWIKSRGAEVFGADQGSPFAAQSSASAPRPPSIPADDPDFSGVNPHGGPGAP